jgi:hypothetical protein
VDDSAYSAAIVVAAELAAGAVVGIVVEGKAAGMDVVVRVELASVGSGMRYRLREPHCAVSALTMRAWASVTVD